MDIVVTGPAGLEGSRIIYEDKGLREKLLERYPKSFFGVFGNGADMPAAVIREYEEQGLTESGTDGGVLAALWRVMKRNRLGGSYCLRQIPILQQTVEICEMFSLNPYRLYAPACRVWLTGDTGSLMKEASAAGIPCSVIGFTSAGCAIRRTDVKGDSSLRRPEEDELRKLLPVSVSGRGVQERHKSKSTDRRNIIDMPDRP